jgi:hypothetical protein
MYLSFPPLPQAANGMTVEKACAGFKGSIAVAWPSYSTIISDRSAQPVDQLANAVGRLGTVGQQG